MLRFTICRMAIHRHRGKYHVPAGLPLKFPNQMHPGFGRRFSACGGRSHPFESHRVPHAPGVSAGKIALRGKVIMSPVGALGYIELQRLRGGGVVHVKVQIIDKMRGAVLRSQGFEP